MLDLSLVADLSRTADALERIVSLLDRLVLAAERLSPPPLYNPDSSSAPYLATVEDLHQIDDQAAETAKASRQDLADFLGVVVDSPAYYSAVQLLEEEMKRHGETVNWKEAFAQARAQNDRNRESSAPASASAEPAG